MSAQAEPDSKTLSSMKAGAANADTKNADLLEREKDPSKNNLTTQPETDAEKKLSFRPRPKPVVAVAHDAAHLPGNESIIIPSTTVYILVTHAIRTRYVLIGMALGMITFLIVYILYTTCNKPAGASKA